MEVQAGALHPSIETSHSASGFEVEGGDVVKLILQFLHEQGLSQSATQLQEEAGVALNNVDSKDTFLSDVKHGRWEAVLPVVSRMKLPVSLQFSVYEQMVLELLEAREVDVARELLRSSTVARLLRAEEPERYHQLETLAQRPVFDAASAYGGASKEKRRHDLAERLAPHAAVVPPSRLLALIGQSLKWQTYNGMLPKSGQYDLFAGLLRTRRVADSEERQVKRLAGIIRFGSKSYAECAVFSPDGTSLLTGSVDGFIEVWDFETCRLRRDLPYQASPDNERFMMHDTAILAITFSRNGEYLASGSKDGKVKVWRLSNGKLLRKFERAHSQGITSMEFSRDSTQVMTASFDETARIHGLKSGKTLKEFRGHTSYIHAICFAEEGSKAITGSADGSIKVWEVRASDCIMTFRLTNHANPSLNEIPIHTIIPMPSQPGVFFVANKSPTAYIVNLYGQVMHSFSSGKAEGGNFTCATLSCNGTFAYCGAEDGKVYCFDLTDDEGPQLNQMFEAVEGSPVIGVVHHPHRNVLATHGGGWGP